MQLRYVRTHCVSMHMYGYICTHMNIYIYRNTYVLELGQMLKFDFEYLFYLFDENSTMA